VAQHVHANLQPAKRENRVVSNRLSAATLTTDAQFKKCMISMQIMQNSRNTKAHLIKSTVTFRSQQLQN